MTKTNKRMATVVMGLPLKKQGQFLIALRSAPKTPRAHNKWQIAGGKLEYGESPEQALFREIKEELSVKVRIIYPHPITKSYTWDFKDRSLHVVLLTYIVDIAQQVPKVDGKENIKFRWIKPSRINQLQCLPATEEIIIDAQNLVKTQNLLKKLSSNQA